VSFAPACTSPAYFSASNISEAVVLEVNAANRTSCLRAVNDRNACQTSMILARTRAESQQCYAIVEDSEVFPLRFG
jgi:hypothetical protein